MAPMANAISELVVLVDDRARSGDAGSTTVWPDLHPAALSVSESTGALVTVAGNVLTTTKDPTTAQEMPVALNSVELAAQQVRGARLRTAAGRAADGFACGRYAQLVQAASRTHEDPRDASVGPALLQAAENLLRGTTSVLKVFDDTAVRRVVALCDAAADSLAKLCRPTNSAAETVQALRQVTTAFAELIRAASDRAKDLTAEDLRARLQNSCRVLRTSSTLLVSAMRSHMQINNANTAESRDYVISGAREAIEEIRRVVAIKFGQRRMSVDAASHRTTSVLYDTPGGVGVPGFAPAVQSGIGRPGSVARSFQAGQEQLYEVAQAVHQADAARVNEMIGSLQLTTAKVVANAHQLEGSVANAQIRGELSAQVGRLERAHDALSRAALVAVQTPDSDEAKQRWAMPLWLRAYRAISPLTPTCTVRVPHPPTHPHTPTPGTLPMPNDAGAPDRRTAV